MRKVRLSDGKEYAFAPLGFTRKAIDLLELYELMPKDDASAEEKAKFPQVRFLRALHACVIDSLKCGGLSEDEAEAAMAGVAVTDADAIKAVLAAMGVVEE